VDFEKHPPYGCVSVTDIHGNVIEKISGRNPLNWGEKPQNWKLIKSCVSWAQEAEEKWENHNNSEFV